MHPIILQSNFTAAEGFKRPQRIISLVPSQTELLASIGLDERVVGITKYCIHPVHWQSEKVVIGGTKNVDIEKIKSLQPDLVIANKEENIREQIELLSQYCPVYVSDVHGLNTALEMILHVGLLVGSLMQAESLVHEIVLAFENLKKLMPATEKTLKIAYLIWRKPYMACGENTFINDMLQRCGWQNVFADKGRYPSVTPEDLQQAAPDVVLLSSEPFPFAQKHIDELQVYLPDTPTVLVDGEMYSWYGSRMLKAPAYFSKLQNELCSLH